MVIWSNPAKDELKQIYDYIALDSKYYALKVINTIIEKSESIENFPRSGRIVPELENEDIREVFIYSYRLIYEIQENQIEILALIHGKRDFLRQIDK